MKNYHKKLLQALKDNFHFSTFKPGQEKVLNAILNHQNILAVLPTGAGKTLIYQLYGFITQRPVLVISPLLSLMQDQVARLKYLGEKRVAAINSQVNFLEKTYNLKHLNYFHYVYVSPETLSQPDVLKKIKQINWGLVVIDEAHCISQWGPDFRPAYLNLGNILKNMGYPLTLLLTATASKSLRCDLINKLHLGPNHPIQEIIYPINRSNIFLAVKHVLDPKNKDELLKKLILQLKKPGIIYFSSRKKANQMAMMLQSDCHVLAAAYHSGLDDESRYKIQHQFMMNQIDVICATSAFGMGIDKSDIRYVVHYHMPVDLEAYSQEIGRAGRDGKQSIAIILYCHGDEQIPYNLMINSLPPREVIQSYSLNPKLLIGMNNNWFSLLQYYFKHHFSGKDLVNLFNLRIKKRQSELTMVLDYINTKGCRRKHLLKYFDETGPVHTFKCCDNGMDKINLKQLNLFSNYHQALINDNENWYKIINNLFNVSKQSKNDSN